MYGDVYGVDALTAMLNDVIIHLIHQLYYMYNRLICYLIDQSFI